MIKDAAKTVIFLFTLLGCVTLCRSQDISALAKKLADQSAGDLQEKLFVHTDKDFYMSGELMWFKIYLTNARTLKPLDLSKVCYVELLSKDNKPVLQAKLALLEAMGNGSFQLPYSVNSGNYVLRAYTNWMKNKGADLFFEKPIKIVNALRQPEWPAATAAAYDLQFFPEGGDLVNGLASRVGFRIVNASGVGVEASGTVVNNNNETVARFSTRRFGMGNFELKTERGQSYKAVVNTADGAQITQALPTALPSGTVMHVQHLTGNKLGVEVDANDGAASVAMIVQSQQQQPVALSKPLQNGKASFELDAAQWNRGITRLTVFGAGGKPVCERLVFSKPEVLPLRLQTDAPGYGTRKKVTIELGSAR
ncbi:MAG: hypothetical protein JO301_16040, partial [Chitinophagaceae bacterium]|nr:hypothetical protein [Chitinophagaceae bacterium]